MNGNDGPYGLEFSEAVVTDGGFVVAVAKASSPGETQSPAASAPLEFSMLEPKTIEFSLCLFISLLCQDSLGKKDCLVYPRLKVHEART